MPPPDNDQLACAWRTYSTDDGSNAGDGCVPIYSSDRVADGAGALVSSVCPVTPWLLAGDSHHARNAIGVLVVTILALGLWLTCFRSRYSFRIRLFGLPCSAGMVGRFFGWSALESDGITAGITPDGVNQPPAQAETAQSDDWCPKVVWPPKVFQTSIAADLVIGVLFAVSLFVDRWFESPRKAGSEMESEVIWGNIQIKYGEAHGISGPEAHAYDCNSISILEVMHSGQCALIYGTGVLIYIIGLIYFIIIGTRLYISIYASLRNVTLVAYRYKLAHRGVSLHKRRVGRCAFHARLVRRFIQIRYTRMYLSFFFLLPFSIFRYLSIRDSLSSISSTGVGVSWVLTLLISLLEVVGVILETRIMQAILDRLDEEAEEKRRRDDETGDRLEEDVDHQDQTDEYGMPLHTLPPITAPTDTRRRTRTPRPAHLLPSHADLERAHMAASLSRGGFGPLPEEDRDDGRGFTTSDIEADRQIPRDDHQSNRFTTITGEEEAEEMKATPTQNTLMIDAPINVRPIPTEPIYSSYVGPSSLPPPVSPSTSLAPASSIAGTTTGGSVDVDRPVRSTRAHSISSGDEQPLVLDDIASDQLMPADNEPDDEQIEEIFDL